MMLWIISIVLTLITCICFYASERCNKDSSGLPGVLFFGACGVVLATMTFASWFFAIGFSIGKAM